MKDEKAVWNLNDLLQGKTITQLEQEAKEKVERFKTFRKQLNEKLTPRKLKEIVILKEDIIFTLEAIGDYYGLKFTTNTKDQEALGRMTYYEQLGTDLGNELIFFSLWFMSLDDTIADKLINAQELRPYKYYLEEVRKAKPYTKSEEVERIISLKSVTGRGAFSSIYDIFTSSFTYSFNDKEGLTQEEVRKNVYDQDPQKREQAYESLLKPYAEHDTVLAELYKNVVLDWGNEGVKIRGYEKPISIRDKGNDIDDEAVQALLKVIRHNASLFTEYFRLRRDLNQQRGATYPHSREHIYAPYAKEKEKKYSYTESKKIVLDTFKQFDKRFSDAAKTIFDANHVHSHPQQGKRPGAFCSYLGGKTKPYIFLNHVGTERDVFTMMHEFGHGIHGVFAEKQTPLLHHAALPMAETASIFAEMLLAERMFNETTSKDEKIGILLRQLDNEWASITRQAYFVLFEQEAHERIKEGATKDELDAIWMSLLKEQFGDMTIPERFKQEWHYIPHIHHTPFYCYAYAWGNLLVLALYDRFKKEGKPFIEQYINLLSAGGSKRPQELLLELGMDATKEEFWDNGFKVIEEQVKQLRQLI